MLHENIWIRCIMLWGHFFLQAFSKSPWGIFKKDIYKCPFRKNFLDFSVFDFMIFFRIDLYIYMVNIVS
jgi:hypothetical protein